MTKVPRYLIWDFEYLTLPSQSGQFWWKSTQYCIRSIWTKKWIRFSQNRLTPAARISNLYNVHFNLFHNLLNGVGVATAL